MFFVCQCCIAKWTLCISCPRHTSCSKNPDLCRLNILLNNGLGKLPAKFFLTYLHWILALTECGWNSALTEGGWLVDTNVLDSQTVSIRVTSGVVHIGVNSAFTQDANWTPAHSQYRQLAREHTLFHQQVRRRLNTFSMAAVQLVSHCHSTPAPMPLVLSLRQ